jgi:hypothetical protein
LKFLLQVTQENQNEAKALLTTIQPYGLEPAEVDVADAGICW